jgi:integrase
LQVIDQLLDLDQLLLEFVAPAFPAIGAPARQVGKLLRALLLLFIKNVRSDNFLVHTELKNNLLYRWFVRLEKDEMINDSFRIALVRLRARLASRLSHDQWQAFLAKTVALAQAQHRLLLAAALPASELAPSTVTHQIFVRLLYLTAARISEALALRWRDLTPLDEGGEAHIMGKGKKRRNVFIPAGLWKDLQGIRGEAADNDRLFPAIRDRFAALQVVKKLAKAAKIEKRVSPHSFRHAHISHALKNGATVAELRDQAGHANISTTSLYAHVSSERATATRLKVQ